MTLELAQAKVADKEQQLAQAQDDLAHLTLTAPFDGVITDVKVKVGDQVTPVAVVMTLSNPTALEAQVTVVEEDYSLIQPGQSAQLYFDAQPDARGDRACDAHRPQPHRRHRSRSTRCTSKSTSCPTG